LHHEQKKCAGEDGGREVNHAGFVLRRMIKRLFICEEKNKPTDGGFVYDLFEVSNYLTIRNKAYLLGR